MTKVTVSKTSPPGAVLLAIEYAKGSNGLVVQEGNANTLVTSSGETFTSNASILRYLARSTPDLGFYGNTIMDRTEVDHWLDFCTWRLTCSSEVKDALQYLDKVLAPLTYLVTNALTLADFSVWDALRGSQEFQKLLAAGEAPRNITRYYKFLSEQEKFKAVAKRLPEVKIVPSKEGKKERKEEGKFIDLPGAEMGKVVVRFPPEASGYLHVGHAKAALLNQYYQQAFNGKLVMRFDDTNPAKEEEEYEKVILEDINMLGLKPDVFTFTSDHFERILGLCQKMIELEKAYVDDTDAETMKKEREERVESAARSNSVKENLRRWAAMKQGTEYGQKCCVRAKIDMKSDNGCLRDPTIYRCKGMAHPRTGTKYKVYPTYDFACPIVDSVEGITHALRTTEYHDRDDQYYWFIDALGLRKPHVWAYSRLNLQNTVMSKRKLTWFVNEGLVDGWDDPRFPTVRGVLRRGMTVEGLKEFVISQGSSRSVVMMEWDKIWAVNKKVIDPIAPRFTALLKDKVVPVKVAGVKEEAKDVAKHPKNVDVGTKKIWYSGKVFIDGADAETLSPGEMVTFINWGNLVVKSINRNNTGEIESIDAELNLQNTDYKKTQKLTWLAETTKAPLVPALCIYFDNIISKPVLSKDDDFKNFVNKDTKTEYVMLGDPELAALKKGDIIQLQRRGYFICDSAYEPPSRHSSRANPCILFYIPDGHTKEMPSSGSKHKDVGSAKERAQSAKGKAAEKSPQDEQPPATVASSGNAAAIDQQITDQGNKIRQLKGEKAAKDVIQQQVKVLLSLKEQYQTVTGQAWKPSDAKPSTQAKPAKSAADTSSAPSGSDSKQVDELSGKIEAQGNRVRQMKGSGASKDEVTAQVKVLLDLKAQYQKAAGKAWQPGAKADTKAAKSGVETSSAPSGSDSKQIDQLSGKIEAQGNKVRQLKGSGASKDEVTAQVKVLLDLKAQYQKAAGKAWQPGAKADTKAAKSGVETSSAPGGSDSKQVDELLGKIEAQGNKVRQLKGSGASKDEVTAHVKVLLDLKAQYQKAAGKAWQPGAKAEVKAVPTATASAPSVSGSNQKEELLAKIEAQGTKVRQLKDSGASKEEVDSEVKQLLALKASYKELTGEDLAAGGKGKKGKKQESGSGGKPKTEKAKPQQGQKKAPEQRPEAVGATGERKKVTRLGLESRKEENLSDWYSQVIKKAKMTNYVVVVQVIMKAKMTNYVVVVQVIMKAKMTNYVVVVQVITKAEMIEYYDISGCYVLRQWSFGIWERISRWFDDKIKEMGFQNCYFPMFVSAAALEKEKEHIQDFAPEVAWVTRSGQSELAEPIAVRPTSETVMYPSYAKWVQSHRDLPIKLNQWCNVVRWEFKHPQPFLRTREFLWQEGHSAHANADDAVKEVYEILDHYRDVYEYLLAVPVVQGRKTEKEKFAGGDFTTTVEAFVSASGRGIQAATSHHLGQNFSKMFDISFEDPETKEKQFAFQNSWGLTTRSIGIVVMVHGDNKGLVLPPRIACIQVVVVPVGVTTSLSEADEKALMAACDSLCGQLKAAGMRVKGDLRDNYSPGWKFNHWELKGVPLRVELGPREVKQGQLVLVRRDTGDKTTVKMAGACQSITDMLDTIQTSMFDKAKKDLDESIVMETSFEGFCHSLDAKKLLLSPFCGNSPCEDEIKKQSARDAVVEEGAPAMGAKALCIPFQQPQPIKASDRCICPGCTEKPQFYTLFGRSY
ncbi:hypothetical protein NP493_277g03032 [Ridgeia piscesae]|uniref:Prolyl-tRNA synthetase n=1 Tax=Ridgeia piscesae TaxID=27915 RepID=A0AAD9NXA2_RIDPI|nr:hypothetical protein NP493_277g03032 [Ridgeia piscesae]